MSVRELLEKLRNELQVVSNLVLMQQLEMIGVQEANKRIRQHLTIVTEDLNRYSGIPLDGVVRLPH